MKNTARLLQAIALLLSPTLFAQTKDVPNSQDHPVVSRFAGSVIKFYEAKNFDAYALRLSPISWGKENTVQKQALEGALTRIVYQSPKATSALEVFRNYEQALQAGGFETLFRCETDACGSGFSSSYPPNVGMSHVRGFTEQQRYIAARRSDDKGTIYVAVFVVLSHEGPVTRLDVAEIKPMQTGQVSVTPAQIQTDFEKTGRAVIREFYFDSGKAVLKPESKPALEAVAQFLRDKPDLNIFVVGHTDSDGGFDTNLQLSQQRAQAVVDELTQQYSIASKRLTARGVSYLCPVAGNDTDAGKARNRRVELVKQ